MSILNRRDFRLKCEKKNAALNIQILWFIYSLGSCLNRFFPFCLPSSIWTYLFSEKEKRKKKRNLLRCTAKVGGTNREKNTWVAFSSVISLCISGYLTMTSDRMGTTDVSFVSFGYSIISITSISLYLCPVYFFIHWIWMVLNIFFFLFFIFEIREEGKKNHMSISSLHRLSSHTIELMWKSYKAAQLSHIVNIR